MKRYRTAAGIVAALLLSPGPDCTAQAPAVDVRSGEPELQRETGTAPLIRIRNR